MYLKERHRGATHPQASADDAGGPGEERHSRAATRNRQRGKPRWEPGWDEYTRVKATQKRQRKGVTGMERG